MVLYFYDFIPSNMNYGAMHRQHRIAASEYNSKASQLHYAVAEYQANTQAHHGAPAGTRTEGMIEGSNQKPE